MAKLIRKKIYKKLNEDDAAQQQQPAADANAQQQNQQQPAADANAQPANNQQGQQPNQQQQQPNQQQPQGPDYNALLNNINGFTTELYTNVLKYVKDNLEKKCPELVAINKDQKNPLAPEAKKVSDAFANLTKIQVKPDDPKSIADTMEAFGTFMETFANFGSLVSEQAANAENAANNPQQQQNGAAQPNNQQQQQPAQNGAQPAGNPNESYDYNGFGNTLSKKLYEAYIQKNIQKSNYFNS